MTAVSLARIPTTVGAVMLRVHIRKPRVLEDVHDRESALVGSGSLRPSIRARPETYPSSLAEFLAQADTFRHADTTMRNLTEDEFLRGKERLRHAVRHAEGRNPETRSNWLDLLVLR